MLRISSILIAASFLTSCTNQSAAPAADAPSATVVMRDGTKAQGKVIESSPAHIKLAREGTAPQSIPMSAVKRVEYADAKAAAPAEEPDDRVRPQASAITTKTFDLPAGTEIVVRNEETIDSAKAVEGQRFAADVVRDVKDAAGDVVIPRGSNAQIVIRSASKGGKIRGASDLVLDLANVSIDGKQYQLSTLDLAQKGRDGIGVNKRTAEFAGGGAAVGAIIGAIAGGGKGAAIGAGSGAGAGAVAEILTKGSIKVPVETRLTFKLDKPLKVTSDE